MYQMLSLMKPIKTGLCTAFLCLLGVLSLHAQQFRLNASPNYPYFLDNIYDLRNGSTAAAPNPVGLVQFIPAAAGGTMGTSIERYNPANGAVLTPTFNYIPAPGAAFQNLRGTKFTEGFGSYFVSGTVLRSDGTEHIFLLKVATGAGNITASRYIALPTGVSRPVVSNILLVGDQAIYVSGTVLFNNRLCVFALRTNLNFTPIAWFRLYPLANRSFSTFAQCLINDGNNGLVLAGVDNTQNRAVVFRVNPANGLISGMRAFSLCAANCAKINRVSLGLSGATRNMVVQTTAAYPLFNVSRMNANWTAHLAGTTYKNTNWDIKSVRFETAGVLLSHLESTAAGAAQWYNRSRYNAVTGALLPGTAFRYQPPTLDLNGMVPAARQIETISMTYLNNRVFSVGKYRHVPANNIRTLAELQPSLVGCQSAFDLVLSPEKLAPAADTILPVGFQPTNPVLPTLRIDLFVTPVQVCAAALVGDEAGERNGETEPSVDYIRAGLTVAPNPFTESLSVTLTEGGIAEIMLFDLTGKMVRQWQLDGTTPTSILQVAGLTRGLYLLRVRDESGGWHDRKILKE